MKLIWIGETVTYKGKNATVIGVNETPFIEIQVGLPEPIKVRIGELTKKNANGGIVIQNN